MTNGPELGDVFGATIERIDFGNQLPGTVEDRTGALAQTIDRRL